MALLIVRFDDNGEEKWGRITDRVPHAEIDIVEVELLETNAATTAELIAEYDRGEAPEGSGEKIAIGARQLLSPVTTDASIICQGLNYGAHAEEAGHAVRKKNLFFAKASSAISGPYDDILRPDGVELLDYELEIGLVLRKPVPVGARVSDYNVGEYVGGVVLANDVSARDVMFGASFFQWFQGKSYRTFCPVGPVLYLMAPSEVAGIIDNLSIRLLRNDEERQSANSAQQIYKAPETLTQLGEIMDIKAGDLLLTGTPGGVLAQGNATVMSILKDKILDDAERRAELVAEFTSNERFLQPGDTLYLQLRDETNNVDLGGQLTRIA